MFQASQITNQTIWQQFHAQQDPQLFVQSWQYAEFMRNYGDDAFFVGISDKNNKLIGGSLVAVINAKRGRFYYLPYGPILPEKDRTEAFKALHTFLKQRANQDKVNFIRISPFWEDNETNKAIFKQNQYRQAPMHMIAETTWVLPLNKEPDALFKEMRQNHRNLIRRADRDGVKITSSTNPADLYKVHELLKITSVRHHFTPFSLKYLQTEFNAFAPDNVTIYNAHYDNKIIAASVVFFYGDTAIYRHGASILDEQYQKIPATYAIQWQAIQDAHSRGLKYYNFWGIAPEGATKHPFYGITRFKKGFGGEQYDLLHCQDHPLNFKYWINYIIESARRIKRGF